MVEHHRLDPERSGQLHQSELLDLAATRPRIAEQNRVYGRSRPVHPTGSRGAEAGRECRPRRQNGSGEESKADEHSDEGLPVLGARPQQRG